ncbi:MAG: FkbM family methyltransferase, partial [Candidatus Omnitrophica bacterium]|nr:FkbM family methyltransferase [Candidatus Omnitrophota bacterium]
SSSVDASRISSRNPIGSHIVTGVTIRKLIKTYGLPYYLKVDIEGADRLCILPLTSDIRPTYLSFEVGDDIEELVNHLVSIGFTKFKMINQCNFRALENQRKLIDRICHKIIYILGYQHAQYVRRNSRFFRVEKSAGPAPWESDGKWWSSAKDLLSKWTKAKDVNKQGGWYDLHAM